MPLRPSGIELRPLPKRNPGPVLPYSATLKALPAGTIVQASTEHAAGGRTLRPILLISL